MKNKMQGDSPWHGMLSWLVAVHGEHVGTWLAKRAGNDIRRLDLSCTDNFRTCSGASQSDSYVVARDEGCCGSFDKRYTWEGKLFTKHYWVGLNFGH